MPLLTVTQTPVVQNTWYPVARLADVKIIYFGLQQDNGLAANADIVVLWQIDGNARAATVNAVDGSRYYSYFGPYTNNPGWSAADTPVLTLGGAAVEAGTALLWMRQTSVPAAGATLWATVRYESLR